jgi:hypothetical protein
MILLGSLRGIWADAGAKGRILAAVDRVSLTPVVFRRAGAALIALQPLPNA